MYHVWYFMQSMNFNKPIFVIKHLSTHHEVIYGRNCILIKKRVWNEKLLMRTVIVGFYQRCLEMRWYLIPVTSTRPEGIFWIQKRLMLLQRWFYMWTNILRKIQLVQLFSTSNLSTSGFQEHMLFHKLNVMIWFKFTGFDRIIDFQ